MTLPAVAARSVERLVGVSTVLQEYNQLEHFRNSLPTRLFATDQLGPIYQTDVLNAVRRRYLQPNDSNNLRWLVYDVDRAGAMLDWQDRACPPPNIVATNRDNGHAHLFYGLEAPVWRQYGARDKAFRYAASIDVALTQKLDADPGYAKLIAKNPLRADAWEVQVFQRFSYDLPWLADYLDLEPYHDQRRNLPPVGLGRNCTLFDRVRQWAYRAIRQVWLSEDFWRYSVELVAQGYNDFPTPLPYPEVKATAKSIGKWTWNNMSREGFNRWAEARRQKSMAVRRANSLELFKKIQILAAEHPEATQRELAALSGASQTTVFKALEATI